MQTHCAEPGCSDPLVVSLAERPLCRAHYLAACYERLEAIAKRLGTRHYDMTSAEADIAGRFLQDCMRSAADFAGSSQTPSNLEKAQVYDVLLWASELHGRLRLSPRRVAKFPIMVRSEMQGRSWEIRTDTQVVSRHGMRFTCCSDIRTKDQVTCIRLDSGARAEGTVAWTKRLHSDAVEAGVEFPHEENFWGLAWEGSDLDDSRTTRRRSR
jgi:hypothetical protein